MAIPIYTYRVGGGPELKSWVVQSWDPLPAFTTVRHIQIIATAGRRRFSHWWITRCGQCGVSIDEKHARQKASSILLRKRDWSIDNFAIGRLFHQEDFDEPVEPRLPTEGEDLSNA